MPRAGAGRARGSQHPIPGLEHICTWSCSWQWADSTASSSLVERLNTKQNLLRKRGNRATTILSSRVTSCSLSHWFGGQELPSGQDVGGGGAASPPPTITSKLQLNYRTTTLGTARGLTSTVLLRWTCRESHLETGRRGRTWGGLVPPCGA